MKQRVRINNQITGARELRVILEDGENLGILPIAEALSAARDRGLDLVEISPGATPPIAKIIDYGKFEYLENKKAKVAKQKAHTVETKSIQVKIGTGDHDLELKARNASKFLEEGHRVKIELFLRGRAKYMDKKFLGERLERILTLITASHKTADGPKASPKGLMIILEKSK